MQMASALFLLLTATTVLAADSRPNILLIVADDLGYSDLGCYGGEIDTPNLNQLAAEGIRYSQFHVNPMCVVTRTSLMTGHTHCQSDSYRRSLPVALLMRAAGYTTSIIGKWHQLGNPLDAGFDSYYGFLDGQIDSWTGETAGRPAIQIDRQRPRPVPSGWYSSDAFTDHAIQQIDAACEQNKPFFTYVAYNAPHSPLHAPRRNVEKYCQRYAAGWDLLRQQRYERQREIGLIDDRYVMTEAEAEVPRWTELSAEMQAIESRRMAAYAGMVDRLDENIGRVLDHLRERGLEENTFVVFFSDNGGDYGNGDIRTYHLEVPWQPGGHPYAATGWAYLKCTPFRWYKSSAFEGGVSVPLILRCPSGLGGEPGSILSQRLHVTDMYPTFLALAGVRYPSSDSERKLEPLYGKSILPLIRDPSLAEYAIHDEIFWAFNFTGKGLVRGNWKISSISDGPWKLFNIAQDPAESTDLATAFPERLQLMSDRWFQFAEQRTVMPPSWRRPLRDCQEGWGFHRMRMVMPAFECAKPRESATGVPLDTGLSLTFSLPISFANSQGRTIRLYAVSDPEHPVWQADPEPGHPAEGTRTISFNDLPRLEPNTTYFLLTDAQWITLGDAPARALNDGAFWYRFRTAFQ